MGPRRRRGCGHRVQRPSVWRGGVEVGRGAVSAHGEDPREHRLDGGRAGAREKQNAGASEKEGAGLEGDEMGSTPSLKKLR